jgi:hypothetical protein
MFRWTRRIGTDEFERVSNDETTYVRDMIDASRRTAGLVSRVTHLLAVAVLVEGFCLAASAAAQVSDQPPMVTVSTLTPERVAASVAAVVGLIGALIGGLALARSARRIDAGKGRRGAIVALVMGPSGLIVGGLVVATADGGLGTGNGLGGGVVAMVVGLIGVALGGMALARSRRIA